MTTVFLALAMVISTIIDLMLDLVSFIHIFYSRVGVRWGEKKHGQNKQTLGLLLTNKDIFLIIAIIICGTFVYLLLKTIHWGLFGFTYTTGSSYSSYRSSWLYPCWC